MSADDRFWGATDRAEREFQGNPDVPAFRRRMKRLGHDARVIEERIEAIHPHLTKGEQSW